MSESLTLTVESEVAEWVETEARRSGQSVETVLHTCLLRGAIDKPVKCASFI